MRLPELSDLHIFRTVVEAGGVTRAAERLNRVQSNVTTRIKKLEDDLGVALFHRDGRRMRLTAAGETLLDYAGRLLALAAEAQDALHAAEPRGILRLGAMDSTAAVRLPRPLRVFAEQHPGVEIELRTGDPRALAAAVAQGELDAALVAEPVGDPRLETRVIYDEELVLISDQAHRPITTPGSIPNPTLLALHPGCPHRSRLEEWFLRANAPIGRVIEVGSLHAAIGCAAAGMGVTAVPRSILDTYTERDRLRVHVPSRPFRPSRTLLVWRRNALQAKVEALAAVLTGEHGLERHSADGRRA